MFCFANRVTSCLQHVLFCQLCSFLFAICFGLPTVYLLVYIMFYFANRVSSCLQHHLFCQPCNNICCLSHFCISCISKRGVIIIWNRNMRKSLLLQIVLLMLARFELPPLVPWRNYSISTLMNHLDLHQRSLKAML
jgi:hypothetical protein